MEVRPKIAIELSTLDKAIEGICLVILILLWVVTIIGFSQLPEQIPSHFNAAGQADDYSSKESIFILPIVAGILYVGMTIINKYPHIYNYPVTVTAENARRLYVSTTRLIRTLKLIVVIIFSGIALFTYQTAINNWDGLGVWFLPVVLGLTFVPIIFYFLKTFKK